MPEELSEAHVDVLIVGAGISGISAACHLIRQRPQTTFRILERRQGIGGTWDLFRYPGIRSDSDMLTFGFNFRPWNDTKILADGASIRDYVRATADEYDVAEKITFGVGVDAADWSSDTQTWTVSAREVASGEPLRFTADFMITCTGYYDYDHGYRPDLPGEDAFAGRLVHPQHWPADLDYRGKRVVVIGSGATAVTLVPAMADIAAHVTMLQRSPSYVLSLPARDKVSASMRRFLPKAVVYRLSRARNIALQRATYLLARTRPDTFKSLLRKGAARELRGSSDLKHFTPSYNPWDQRLCIIPDGDLFRAIRSGGADVVTDTIDTFTGTGIRLASGAELDADIVVVATGLTVQLFGGATLSVDGKPVPVPERLTYKSVLLEGVPNLAFVFGYINASWTLKADLAAQWVCRLLDHMDAKGYRSVVARATDADRTDDSVLSALNSGYVRRGNAVLPRQGSHGVWQVRNDYLHDTRMLRFAGLDDDALRFDRAVTPAASHDRARSASA